jgi:hypothetical protein
VRDIQLVDQAPALSFALKYIVCVPKVKLDFENDAVVATRVPVVQLPSRHSYPAIVPSESLAVPPKETEVPEVIVMLFWVGEVIVTVGMLLGTVGAGAGAGVTTTGVDG